MTIKQQIDCLLDDETTEDQQYDIIQEINAKVYDETTLFELTQIFLEHSVQANNPFDDTIDIVGTGGDNCKTLNYSTLSAFIAHYFGAKVAKHGSRSATSQCGSFDFLQKLGISLPENIQQAHDTLKESGLVFLFAPFFHPVFAKVTNVRKRFAQEGTITFFNLLGPLLNPMRVKRIVAGVYNEKLLHPYLYALKNLGITHAYIVYGDGMDEFSTCGVNKVIKLHNNSVQEFSLHPEQAGFVRGKLEYLQAGDFYQNIVESKDILANNLLGVKQDTLIINAAASLHVAKDFNGTLLDQIEIIKTALKNGDLADLL